MKIKEFFKKHWKLLAIVGAGIAGLYLLMQRQGGGSAASSAGLPSTGPPPTGNQTPSYFSPSEQAAAGVAQNLQGNAAANAAGSITDTATVALGKDIGGNQEYSYSTGAISKAWQQVVQNGQIAWEDIYHPGHIVTDQQAQGLAGQNSGPYARGGGGFFGPLTKVISNVASNALGNFASAEASQYGLNPNAPGPVAGDVPAPSISPTPLGPPAPTATAAGGTGAQGIPTHAANSSGPGVAAFNAWSAGGGF